MINIEVGKKKHTLKFTYNSFKYMENLSIEDMTGLGNNPFKMIGILEQLFTGAINHDRKTVYVPDDAVDILYKYLETAGDGAITDIFTKLTEELTISDFFKSLQNSK